MRKTASIPSRVPTTGVELSSCLKGYRQVSIRQPRTLFGAGETALSKGVGGLNGP